MSEKMSGSSTNGSSKKRKALSAALAVAMVATMLLSGTLAYFYQSRATNLFENDYKKVVAHDDFDDEGYKSESGVSNKDIYVENVGATSVYVRVKLSEGYIKNGVTIQDPSAPTSHTMAQTEPYDTAPTDGAGSAPITVNDTETSHADAFHSDFVWTMGNGTEATVLSATDDQFADANNKAEGIYLDTSNGAEVAHDDYSKGVMKSGATTRIVPVCSVISMAQYAAMPFGVKSDGTEISADATNEEKSTADLEQSKANKDTQLGFIGWVGDEDGWFYWSRKLQQNSVTGFLLNSVTATNKEMNFKYNIDVTYEAVDDTDKAVWKNPADNSNQKIDEYNQPVSTEKASNSAWKLMDNALYVDSGGNEGSIGNVKAAAAAQAEEKYGAAAAYRVANASQIKEGAGSGYAPFASSSDMLAIAEKLLHEPVTADGKTVISVHDSSACTDNNGVKPANAGFFTDANMEKKLSSEFGSLKYVKDEGENTVLCASTDSGAKQKWVLVKDELKAVKMVSLDWNNYCPTLEDLSKTEFENFDTLAIDTRGNAAWKNLLYNNSRDGKTTYFDSLLDETTGTNTKLKALLVRRFKGDADKTVALDVSQFTALENIYVDQTDCVSSVIVPISVKQIDLYDTPRLTRFKSASSASTAEAFDGTGLVKVESLSTVKSNISSYIHMDEMTALKHAKLDGPKGSGSGQSGAFDLHNANHLNSLIIMGNWFDPEALKVKVSDEKTAFAGGETTYNYYYGTTESVKVQFSVGNMGLDRVDISKWGVGAVYKVGASNTKLKAAVRRSDQEFTDLPTGGSGFIEKVIDADDKSKVTYYQVSGGKRTKLDATLGASKFKTAWDSASTSPIQGQ